MELVYENGKIVKEYTFKEIRENEEKFFNSLLSYINNVHLKV